MIFPFLVHTIRWIFFILSIFGIRIWLARLIPKSLTLAVGAGIGLFICTFRFSFFFALLSNHVLQRRLN